MAGEIDLKEIKRKVYLTYFRDGWWDILLGALLLIWGISLSIDAAAYSGLIFVLLYFIVWFLKRKTTYPRIGHVRLAEEKRSSVKLLIIGVIGFVAAALYVLLAARIDELAWFEAYSLAAIGVFMALTVVLIALWWNVRRWYWYAALMLLSIVAYQWMGLSFPLSFILPGAVILLNGVFLLVRFMNKYPRINEDALRENE